MLQPRSYGHEQLFFSQANVCSIRSNDSYNHAMPVKAEVKSEPSTFDQSQMLNSVGELCQDMYPKKPGRPHGSSFVKKLWQILLDASTQNIVCWDARGTQFSISDRKLFAENILPRYFAHNKFSSFTRQLGYFKFVRHRSPFKQALYFSHPDFLRNDYERAIQICSTYKNKPKDMNSQKRAAPFYSERFDSLTQPYTMAQPIKKQRIQALGDAKPSIWPETSQHAMFGSEIQSLNRPTTKYAQGPSAVDPREIFATLKSLAVINQCLEQRGELPAEPNVHQNQNQQRVATSLPASMPSIADLQARGMPQWARERPRSNPPTFSATTPPQFNLVSAPQLSVSAIMSPSYALATGTMVKVLGEKRIL
jgi:hypothetical protein